MSFLGKIFSKKKKADDNSPVMVASVYDNLLSEMYQDILKENSIPFICHQQGAGGYLKVVTGGLGISDNIYVSKENYNKAKELYDMYINEIGSNENFNSEEQI